MPRSTFGSLDSFLTGAKAPPLARSSSAQAVKAWNRSTMVVPPSPPRDPYSWYGSRCRLRALPPVLPPPKKVNPRKLAKQRTRDRLARIQLGAPTEWLSPFGGNDSTWMGSENTSEEDNEEEEKGGEEEEEEWGGEAEKGCVTGEELQEQQGDKLSQAANFRQDAAAFKSGQQKFQGDNLNLEAAEEAVQDSVQLEPLSQYPINPIARRSTFFGKCRLASKIAKQTTAAARHRGRMAEKTQHAIAHATPETPRTGQIVAAYLHGLIPRPSTMAQVTPDGTLDLSGRGLGDHHRVLLEFLRRTRFAAHVAAAEAGDAESVVPPILRVSLRSNRLGDAAAAEIVLALAQLDPDVHGLVSLDLSNNKLGRKTAAAICRLLAATGASLQELRVSGCFPGVMSHQALLAGLATTVTESNKTTKKTESKGKTPMSCCLRVLDLSHNRIDSAAAVASLAVVVGLLPSLHECRLDWNNLGRRGGIQLARAVQQNATNAKKRWSKLQTPAAAGLHVLGLSFNRIGDEAALVLARALATPHPELTELFVDGCDLGDEAATALADAMVKARAARTKAHACILSMLHNHIGTGVGNEMLQRNQREGKEAGSKAARRVGGSIDVRVYPVSVGDGEGSIDPLKAFGALERGKNMKKERV